MSNLNLQVDSIPLTSHIGELAKIMIDESLDIVIPDSKNYVKYKVKDKKSEDLQFSDINKGIIVGSMSVLGLLTQYEKTELKNVIFALSEHNHTESVDIKLREFLKRGAKVFIVRPEGEVVLFKEDGTLVMLSEVDDTEVVSVIPDDTDESIVTYTNKHNEPPVKSKVVYTFDVAQEGITMVAINIAGEVSKLLNLHDNTSVSDFINQIKTRDLVKYGVVLDRYIIAMDKSCVLDSDTFDELRKLTKNSPSHEVVYFNSSLKKLELVVEYYDEGFDDYIKSNNDCIHHLPLVSEHDIMKHKKVTYHDYSIDLDNPEVRMIMVGVTGKVYKLVNPLISIIDFIDNTVMCERSRNNNTVKDFIIVTRISYMNNLDVVKALKLHTSESHLSPIVVTDSAPMVTFRTDRTLDYTVLSTEELQDVFIYLTGGAPRDGGGHENMKHLLFQVLSTMNNMNQHVGILTETGNLYTTKSQDMCYNRPFGDMNTNEENRPKFVILANEEAFTRKNIDFISAISAFTEANIRFFKSTITSPHNPMFI